MDHMELNDVNKVEIKGSTVNVNLNFSKEHIERFIKCVEEIMKKEEGKSDRMIRLLEEIRNLLIHKRR